MLRCHIAAFADLGGVPEEILYDRMKTAVIGEAAEGGIVYNRTLLDFAGHYRFHPKACRPYRAKTKGKVERPFRYIRQDFFLGRTFRNLDDLNTQLADWLATVANVRVHATTQRVVAEAFAEEKSKLQELPSLPFGSVLKLERRVSHEGMVSVGGNLYSVPDATRKRRGRGAHARRRDPHLRGRCAHRHSSDARRARPATGRPRSPEAPRRRRKSDHYRRCHADPRPSRRARRPPVARRLRGRRPPSRRQGRAGMTAAPEIVPAILDRIRRTLVGLRMPRALEVLDRTVRQLERGEVSPLDAIDTLLAEELTVRESRRIKTALVMARLTAVKTLAGFDFSFQPSLDRNRILTLAQLEFIDRNEVRPCPRPARHRQDAPGGGARRRGGEGRSQRLLLDPRRHHRLAGQGRARGMPARTHPLARPRRAAHRRRDRLPAGRPRRRQPVLPAGQCPLRKGRR